MLVLVLGVGHAVLTDGALDEAGTPLLIGLGALGLVGIGAALVLDARRALARLTRLHRMRGCRAPNSMTT